MGLVDYPPNAIVLLSPLGLLPLARCASDLDTAEHRRMAILAPYCAARFFRPHDPFRVVALPILMFLCWGGVRTLTQFTLIALTCSSVAAMVSPIAGAHDERPLPRAGADEAAGRRAGISVEPCSHAAGPWC